MCRHWRDLYLERRPRESRHLRGAVTYPKGFLYTYKTIFSNSYRSFARIQGRDGTIENYGGEGASLFA